MERNTLCALALLLLGSAASRADDPVPAPQPPRTHVDTEVVGDASPDHPTGAVPSANLNNDHNFKAGAPEVMSTVQNLQLSPKQQERLKTVIENGDAGAAGLIRREHAVSERIASTAPENDAYPALVAEQSSADARWTENRAQFRSQVLEILTPVQRKRYLELQPDQK